MKYTLPLIALSFVLAFGCGKPTGKSAGKSPAPVAPAETDANRSTVETVADSLQDISNTIRNVQALSENVKNIRGLQLVSERIAWEYKIIDPSDAEISLETRLNDLGKEGWELSASSPKGKFIFKRRQQQKK
ncbi:MAG TPA: hypothetical protein EYG19_07780 [Verrucomicrobia bacterium]|nr:hypothetical protein [Verrucomicrobiota bacterium]